jgi:RecB family exonuclease
VLEAFGRSELSASTAADKIAALLNHALDDLVRERYGADPLPVIQVQVEQLRTRLMAFAQWQAGWAGQGWRIECVEQEPEDGAAAIPVDGEPMFLRGRIDRIDVNEWTGERAVFDYKSSNNPDGPEKTHQSKGEWIDLQLPLYRHLAAGLGIDGPVRLGYIVLPKDPKQVQGILATWTEDDLREADRKAEDVVRGIRAEAFWPPTMPPPPWFDEFAAICQDGQLIAADLIAGEEGELAE